MSLESIVATHNPRIYNSGIFGIFSSMYSAVADGLDTLYNGFARISKELNNSIYELVNSYKSLKDELIVLKNEIILYPLTIKSYFSTNHGNGNNGQIH